MYSIRSTARVSGESLVGKLKYLTIWLSGPIHSVRVAGQSIIAGTSLAQSVSVATVLMHDIEDSTLLGDLLVHFVKRNFRHDGGV